MPTRSPRQRFTLIARDAGQRLSAFGRDVEAGLTRQPKSLPCCYFYDREGSQLFEDICELPEYYLPQAEREVLRRHGDELAGLVGSPLVLVELGSGNAAKTRLLIDAVLRRQDRLRYVPLDICRTVLEDSSVELLEAYPNLEITAIAAEYHEGMRHLKSHARERKLVLWLGSNVGNFDRAEAAGFLRQVRQSLADSDRLLVGIDLRKERAVLEKAYDDSRGLTAQFNLNILARINRELGGHFDPNRFRHRAVWNDPVGRIEMYLVSTSAQQVAIDRLGLDVIFAEGEAVHTENSYKYSLAEIESLARDSGLTLERQWLDSQGRFSTNLFRPAAT